MARGVNKVILIGHIGTDPEVRYMPSGAAIATLSLATTESWKDKNTGEKQERTEWHRVVCFNRLGEIVSEYVRKGSKLYVEGSLRTRKWQDQQGQDRYTTEIVASDIQMLDNKGTGSTSNAGMNAHYDDYPQAQFSAAAPAPQAPKNNANAIPQDVFAQLDDDVPF